MKSSLTKTEILLEPKAEATEVIGWWRPDTRSGFGYNCYRVKVLERSTTSQQDLLTFSFLGESVRWTVDLHDTVTVWPELPSTAQLANVGQYGFLLIASGPPGREEYTMRKPVESSSNQFPQHAGVAGGDRPPRPTDTNDGGGGKWPKGSGVAGGDRPPRPTDTNDGGGGKWPKGAGVAGGDRPPRPTDTNDGGGGKWPKGSSARPTVSGSVTHQGETQWPLRIGSGKTAAP